MSSPQRTSRPSTRNSSRSRRRSAGRPSWIPCSRTGSASRSLPRIVTTPRQSCPTPTAENGSTAEPLLAEERHEPARNGFDDRRPFRAANDELEALDASAADRDRQPPTWLELVVEAAREVGSGGRDRDRAERRALEQAARPVADVDVDVRVAGRREVRARRLGELRDPLDRVDLARQLGEHRGLVTRAGADVEHAFAALERKG